MFLLFPRVHLSFTFIDTQRLISPVGFCLTCSIVSCIPEGDCCNTSHTNLSISPTSPTPLHADPQAPLSCVSTFHRRLLFDLPLVLFEQNIKEHMHDCRGQIDTEQAHNFTYYRLFNTLEWVSTGKTTPL